MVIVEPDTATQTIHNIRELMKFPKVDPSKPAEVAERIDHYFSLCENGGSLPTVEGLGLALGVTRQTVWYWETATYSGIPAETVELIRRAKLAMAATDAELANRQKINPVSYIFRAKNFYGMSDRQDIKQIVDEDRVSTRTIEEIMERYGTSIEAEDNPYLDG